MATSRARHTCADGLRSARLLTRPHAASTGSAIASQHRDKCSEQRDQEARVHESSNSNDLVGRAFLDW